MKHYEYTAFDRLQNPHNYMYSPYGGKEFIRTYLNDRNFHISSFNTLGVEKKLTDTESYLCESSRYFLEENKYSTALPSMVLITSVMNSKKIITEDLLMSLLGAQFSGQHDDMMKNIIDTLVQKFEVKKNYKSKKIAS